MSGDNFLDDATTTRPTAGSPFVNDEHRWPWLLRVSLPAALGGLITVLVTKATAESAEDQQRREETKAQAVGKAALEQSREALYQKLQAMYLELDATEIGSRRRVLDTIESEFARSNPNAVEFVARQRIELAGAEEKLRTRVAQDETARGEYEKAIRELRSQAAELEAQLLQSAAKDGARVQALTTLRENKQREIERLEAELKATKQALAEAQRKPTSGPGRVKPCSPGGASVNPGGKVEPEPKRPGVKPHQ